jgi:DNA anti-recombination protein RmuC
MMAFQPDIIVTGPDGVVLVVDPKASLPNLDLSQRSSLDDI